MAKTILVIDNDETLVELLQYFFEQQGYTVWTAHDGDVGVEMAVRHRPAAIVCDMIMGQMHGFEVLQQLRQHPELATTPIIAASAKAYPTDIARARELGVTDYLVKPFELDALYAAVERHVGEGGAPP